MKSLLDTKTRRPLTKDESEVFVTLLFAQNPDLKEPLNRALVAKYGDAPGSRIMLGRLTTHADGVLPEARLAFLLDLVSEGNPGNLVMWAWTLYRMSKQLGHKLVTLDDFASTFPSGVPDSSAYSEVWAEQKTCGGGNALDHTLWSTLYQARCK